MSDKITPLLTPEQALGLIEQLNSRLFAGSALDAERIIRANAAPVPEPAPKFRVGQLVISQHGSWWGRVAEIRRNGKGSPCYRAEGEPIWWQESVIRAVTPEEIAGPEGAQDAPHPPTEAEAADIGRAEGA